VIGTVSETTGRSVLQISWSGRATVLSWSPTITPLIAKILSIARIAMNPTMAITIRITKTANLDSRSNC
jgi:hypothetical protein